MVASGVLELVYFALLARAYRGAELSVVYPLARGVAPVLVLVVGLAALGRETSWAQAAGVVVVGGGVVLVRGPRRAARGSAVAFALVIASVIAAYTLVDKEGIQHANPIAYLEVRSILPALVYGSIVLALKGRNAVRAEANGAAVVAGIGMFTAYALVLAALERAPAAPVAAVRETSIVIAAALAWVVLNEDVGRARLAGAAVVAAGVVLLGVS